MSSEQSMYIQGNGVRANMAKGSYWLTKSARQGNKKALEGLKIIKEHGY